MDLYNLNVNTSNIGGYFSSEQLDMLSIIQCQTYEEIISFIYQCKQLNGVFSKEDFQNFTTQNLDQLKRSVFKKYQDTLVPHNSNKQVILDNTLHRLSIKQEDIDIKIDENLKQWSIIPLVRSRRYNSYF